MIATEIAVLTPSGRFVAQWDDNPDSPVTFAGSQEGIAFFRQYMDTTMVTGAGGLRLDPDQLEPADLVGFCASPEYGITVLPDADFALADAEQDAREQQAEAAGVMDAMLASDDPAATLAEVLDSVSPLERVKLLGVLSAATAGLQAAASPIARVKAAKAVADALAALGVGGSEDAPGADPEDDGLSDDPSSPNYRYKDTGYIADSRKERAANMLREARSSGRRVRMTDIDWDAMETNPRQAAELVVKANLFGKTDWQALRDAGMDPGAGFLIDKVYASIGPEPTNALPVATIKAIGRDRDALEAMTALDRTSPEAMAQTRRDYALGLESIRERMEACRTVEDVKNALAEIRDELFGATLSSDQADVVANLQAKIQVVYHRKKELREGQAEAWKPAREVSNKIRDLQYEQSKRERRKWKPDPEIAKQIADLEAELPALEKVGHDYIEAHPEAQSKWINELGGSYSPLDLMARELGVKVREIQRAAFRYNMLSNPTARAWLALGERFLNLVNFRSFNGSDAFSKHYTTARTGGITDWSWAEKEAKAPTGKKPTKEGVAFQLKVADSFERVGGKPVPVESTSALKDMLGLRDVQSGNWVLRDPVSAKFHVEQTAGAMSDMADVLGIDMKHLGLGGRLAIAFGARGTGNTGFGGAARAHYEPVHRVVNLTKVGGGGALGHELFHALDNIIPALATGTPGNKGDYASSDPTVMPEGKLREAFAKLRTTLTTGDVRLFETIKVTDKDRATAKLNLDRTYLSPLTKSVKEAGTIEAAVRAVDAYFGARDDKRSLRNKKQWRTIAAAYYAEEGVDKVRLRTGRPVSSFMAEAQRLDGGELGKYWSKYEEMAARAFQAYLEDRLAEQGRRNDYLSVFADNKHYVDPLFGQSNPFPEGEERTRFNAAFDAVFAALREEQVFEKASANTALLDAIFGTADDAVMDSAEVVSAQEALARAVSPIDKIKAAKVLADSIEQSKANAMQQANANGTMAATAPDDATAMLPADNKFLNRAMSAFEAGFTTQAAKKDAMSDLSRVYGDLRGSIQERVLEIPREQQTPDQTAIYWDLPQDLHNWRPKHADLVLRVFPGEAGKVDQINALFELRGKFNAAPVNKAPPKDERERQRVEAANGSMDPSINHIVSQLESLKPEVAKEFRESLTPQVQRLLEKWQSGEDMEQYHRDTRGRDKQLEAFITFEGVYADRVAIGIDSEKIERESHAYADHQIKVLIHKLIQKIGNLKDVEVHNLRAGSGEFSLTGTLGEQKVSIHQKRIINASALGNLYHQWPALIYVDGKAVSEAQYRGLSGNEGTGKPTINVGSKVKIGGRVVEVTAIRYATARGIGPGINGQHVEFVYWQEDGKERGYPKRYARLVS